MSKQCVVSELFVHPVKGCRPAEVTEVEINEYGVKGDREFMVVRDQKNVNLKDLPGLAKVSVEQISPGHIRLAANGVPPIEHRKMQAGVSSTVTLILDNVEVWDQGDEIAGWISSVVGEAVRLVAAPNAFVRNFPVEQLELAHQKLQQGFKDVSPVMIVNAATLEDLNSKLPEPIPVQRFRPNIVVSGLDPYAEDNVNILSHSQIKFTHVSPCERCVVINIDHELGVIKGKDPLNTLGKYRRIENKYSSGIVFGNYFNTQGDGRVKIGDEFVVS